MVDEQQGPGTSVLQEQDAGIDAAERLQGQQQSRHVPDAEARQAVRNKATQRLQAEGVGA